MREVPSRDELRRLGGELTPRSPICEAARVQLCLQAIEVDVKLPEALATLRPAPVHDARVAGRRLRAGASLFRSLYPGVWEEVSERARRVTRGLRLVRDLDIRRDRLRRLARHFKGRAAVCRSSLARLLDETTAARLPLRKGAGDAGLTERFMAPVLPALASPRCSGASESERFSRVCLGELALASSCLIPVASVEGLAGIQHRLRIRGKALRYSLEMMEWRLGEEAAWRTEVLRRAQDILGEMHDIDMFLELLHEEAAASGRRPGVPGRFEPAAGKRRPDTGAARAVRARPDSHCCQEVAALLSEERHQFFVRFLDMRGELERACAALSPRRVARSNA
jgi:CHAD domain-containing protein